MSEVNSLNMTAMKSNVSTDPVTGEIVGGLTGLRELIRVKQEQLANRDGNDKADGGSNSDSSDNKGDTIEGKSAKNRKRRRNRNKNKAADASSSVSSELIKHNMAPKASDDDFKLPFTAKDIVYGEITRNKGEIEDIKLYISSNSRLLIYTKSVYENDTTKYIKVAHKLLRNAALFDMASVANVEIFVSRAARIEVINDELTYGGKYKIECNNEKVLRMAKRIVDSRKDDEKLGEQEMRDKKLTETVKDEVPTSDKPEGQSSLIASVLKVQQVVKRVQDADEPKPCDAMEIFLTLGEASPKLLVQILAINNDMAESLIDQLRLMHALGDRDGKTYPILISDIDELGHDVGYTLQSQADNFRSAVHVESVRGKKLVYDLDEVCMVKAADEYLTQVAEFCRAIPSRQIHKLFSDTEAEVRVSEVLRILSNDDETPATADYELFHQYVTKFMLVSDWLTTNPTDGFPWMQFQVDKTDNLKVDTLRYLLSNLAWITATYDESRLNSLSGQVANLELASKTGAANNLREALLTKLSRAITRIESTKDESMGKAKTIINEK